MTFVLPPLVEMTEVVKDMPCHSGFPLWHENIYC